MPDVTNAIRAPVVIDLSDIPGSVTQVEKAFRKMERIAGGAKIKINGKEVKDFSEKTLRKFIKNLTQMSDKAKVAAENIRSINKAIKAAQGSRFTPGMAQQMGSWASGKTTQQAHLAAQKELDAQALQGTRGYVKAQKEAAAAKRTLISMLREEKKEHEKIISARMKELEVSVGPRQNSLTRMMMNRKQETNALRKELNLLIVAGRKYGSTMKDNIRIAQVAQKLNNRGVGVMKQYRAEVQKATKAAKAHQDAQRAGTLNLKMRAQWFLQLRVFWGALRAIQDTIDQIMEKDEAMARALRTSRVGGIIKDRTQIINEYEKSLNTMASRYGAAFKDTGEALYQLGSAGLTTEESLAALDSTMKLLIGTEGDAREVTKAVASIYNNFGDTMTEQITLGAKMTHINATLANTWRDHQVEINELVQGLSLSSQMANVVGVSFEELTAMLGVLNTHMIKSGRAGRSLQNVWSRMSKAPMEFARTFGIAMDPTKPLKFNEIMTQLNERFKEGKLSVAQVGDMFTRLGLRGAPAFAALIQYWDEVGEAMMKNIEKGQDGLKELQKEMTTRFRGASERFAANIKVLMVDILDEIAEGFKVLMNRISNNIEAMNARIRLQEMYAKEKMAYKGMQGGKITDVEDLEELRTFVDSMNRRKSIIPLDEQSKAVLEWAVKRVSELEEKEARIVKHVKEQAEIRKKEASKPKELKGQELADFKAKVADKMVMAEATSIENAERKLEILKRERDVTKGNLDYYLEQTRGIEGESEVILKTQKELLKVNKEIAGIENLINAAIMKKAKELKKIKDRQAVTAYKMQEAQNRYEEQGTGLAGQGEMEKNTINMQRERDLAKLQQQYELESQMTQNKLELEKWYVAEKQRINFEADSKIADNALATAEAHKKRMLEVERTMWMGGGNMGGGMIGAYNNYADQKAETELAVSKAEKSGKKKDVEYAEKMEEKKTAMGIETARATVGAASQMFLQMAQMNKKWFRFYQATAIAEAIIATSQGIMRAYQDAGPYLGTVFAAIIAATGAMKIAMIAKQKPPEYAQGGVFDASKQRGMEYATGGVTSGAAMAMLGDNASGKELVIPAEHIDSEHTAGYTRDAGGAPTIVNLVTSDDVANAMNQPAGRNVVVNHIGKDMQQRKSTYHNVRDTAQGRQ